MIHEFQGNFRFLSNFWPAPIIYMGQEYKSVEHAYQSLRCNDLVHAAQIATCGTSSEAKRLAKLFPRKPNWPDIKYSTMLELVQCKFNQNTALAQMLRATGDAELIEGNWWNDTYWGVCNGIGENHLGKILMQVRKELA